MKLILLLKYSIRKKISTEDLKWSNIVVYDFLIQFIIHALICAKLIFETIPI